MDDDMKDAKQSIFQRAIGKLDKFVWQIHKANIKHKKPKLHILIADDEPNIRRLIQVNLERVGFATTTVANGEEVLQKLTIFRPDVLVLDIMMPDKDGFEVLAEIRKEETLHTIPILILGPLADRNQPPEIGMWMGHKTCLTMGEIPADCHAQGVTRIYMGKPFKPSDMVAGVQFLLPECFPEKRV
jgi:CheY-like chemotaxis protein